MKQPTEVTLMRTRSGREKRVTLHDGTEKVIAPPLVWKAVWWGDRDGRRLRFTETIGAVCETTKRDAKRFCTEKQDAINAGRVSPDRLGPMTLEAFLDADLEGPARADLKATSLCNLATARDHAITALGPTFNVHKLDAAAVLRIREYLQDRGLAPVSAAKSLAYLQGAFRRGVDLGLVHDNPFSKMKRMKFQTPRPKTFTRAEVDAMLEICRERADLWWETFIRLGVTSGCRRGEMVHLRWDSIDWDEGSVTINPQKGGTFTVAGETYPLLAWESKDFETRIIPLPPETLDGLRLLKDKQALLAGETGLSPYVFIALDRLRVIGEHQTNGVLDNPNYPILAKLSWTFRRIQDQAAKLNPGNDWAPGRSIKTLRSTYGSRLAEYLSSFQLKSLLGHSSVKTTEKHYVASSRGDDVRHQIQAAFGTAKAEAS